jgi:quinol monooxygenase YgiN
VEETKMAVTVILELPVKPENRDEMVNALKGALPDTRAYDGCIKITAFNDQDNTNTIVLYEEWETRGHHEAYMKFRTESGFIEAMAGMLTGESKFMYLDTLDA